MTKANFLSRVFLCNNFPGCNTELFFKEPMSSQEHSLHLSAEAGSFNSVVYWELLMTFKVFRNDGVYNVRYKF